VSTAIRRLRQATALDPLRESACRALMEALAADCNLGAATEVYRDLRLRLHRELNAQPDPETAAVYARIKQEAAGRRAGSGRLATAAHQPVFSAERAAPGLPRSIASFVGRERELEEVRDLLESGRLVTLVGAGGVGKTRLALRLAEEVADGFPDGV